MSGMTSAGGDGECNTASSGFEEDVGKAPGEAAGAGASPSPFSLA